MDMPPPPSYSHTIKERDTRMFVLPPLPYAYNALEPFIDTQTMEIHHTKHHQTYVDNLNKALADYPELQKIKLEDLLKRLDTIPAKIRTAVRNNAGGHLNHSFFWEILTPQGQKEPQEVVLKLIKRDFGSFEDFKDKFAQAAKSNFGSGWTWLCLDKNGTLSICSTPNQDNPIMQDLSPILGLDVWEHAYYLKYQNKRIDYIQAFWNIVNWQQVEKNYKALTDQKKQA